MILLAGQVGRNEFVDGIGRSILDLPLEGNRTVLDVWMGRIDRLAASLSRSELHCLTSVDRAGVLPRPRTAEAGSRVRLEVVRDPAEYRGTAGVVRDLTRDYGPGDWLLVAAANQVVCEPLESVFEELALAGESVSIVPVRDSEFAGMFLLRAARLAVVPDIGFVDLKEQAIPAARGHAPLRVVRRAAGSSRPVRTLDEYVSALRAMHGRPGSPGSGQPSSEDPFAETWQPAFSIVEPAAQVAPGAIIQDSVVLAGARVEAGAALARSVVCAGAVVRSSDCLVETLVREAQ